MPSGTEPDFPAIWLIAFLGPSLALRWEELGESDVSQTEVFNGQTYGSCYEDSIFFDFLLSDDEEIVAVELQPSIPTFMAIEHLFKGPTRPSYCDIVDDFPVFWLTEHVNSRRALLEAFAADYLTSADGSFAIRLPMSGWATERQIERVRTLPLRWV